MKRQTNFYISMETLRKVNRLAKEKGISRSQVVDSILTSNLPAIDTSAVLQQLGAANG